MKCVNCSKKIDGNLTYCPHCGTPINSYTEMPELNEETLKNNEDDLSKYTVIDLSSDNDRGDYTNSLDVIDLTKEKEEPEDNNPFENGFNNNFEDNNPVVPNFENTIDITNEENSPTTITKPIIEIEPEENIFTSKVEEPVAEIKETKEEIIEEPIVRKNNDKRKNVFFTVSIFVLAVIFGLVAYLLMSNTNLQKDKVDYASKVSSAMEKYYKENEITELQEISDGVKDEEELARVQAKSKEVFYTWLDEFKTKDIEDFDDFSSSIKLYKNILKEIYELPQNGEKIISTEDYKELSTAIDNISKDSTSYIDAIKYYQAKSYNESYFMFSKIDKNSAYYEKAQTYLTRIESDVINVIKEDISKMETGIDSLSAEEKRARYTQIEEVINVYSSIYSNIKLNSNNEYQKLLEDYQIKKYNP